MFNNNNFKNKNKYNYKNNNNILIKLILSLIFKPMIIVNNYINIIYI